MPKSRLIALTAFAMIPLAANSWLCRAALRDTTIDAASFTSVRLLSGTAMLWLLLWLTGRTRVAGAGSWPSAIALFGYAALFSFAYLSLTAATGALILFGAVQVTMIGLGLRSGERLDALQVAGVALAFGGLVGLLLPGLSAPPLGVRAGLTQVIARAGPVPVLGKAHIIRTSTRVARQHGRRAWTSTAFTSRAPSRSTKC